MRYTTEEKRQAGTDMCARCGKIAECYIKQNGIMEFIPCKAYLKAVGVEPGKNIEYLENYDYYAD